MFPWDVLQKSIERKKVAKRNDVIQEKFLSKGFETKTICL